MIIVVFSTVFALAILREFMPRWLFYTLMSMIYAYLIMRFFG